MRWVGVAQPGERAGARARWGVAQPAQRRTHGWTGAGTVPPVPTKGRRGGVRTPSLGYNKGVRADPSDRACLPIAPPCARALCNPRSHTLAGKGV